MARLAGNRAAAAVFTLGDLFDKRIAQGGLAFSRYTTTAMLAAAMVAIIAVFPQRPGVHPGSLSEIASGMTYDGSWRRPVTRRERIGRSYAYSERATLGVKCVGKFGPASFSAA